MIPSKESGIYYMLLGRCRLVKGIGVMGFDGHIVEFITPTKGGAQNIPAF